MAVRRRLLGPFRGIETAADRRYLPAGVASEALNVRVWDGALAPRWGYRSLSGAPAGLSAVWGFDRLAGYDGSYQFVEEWLSVETRSGATRPYTVDPSTGVRTEILNGAAHVDVEGSPWRACCFDGLAYLTNPNGSVHRHAIGNAASMVALPNMDVTDTQDELWHMGAFVSHAAAPATMTGCTVVTTGPVSSTTVGAADRLDISVSGTGTITVEVTFAAPIDWMYDDTLLLASNQANGLATAFRIDQASVVASFRTSNGWQFATDQVRPGDLVQTVSSTTTAAFPATGQVVSGMRPMTTQVTTTRQIDAQSPYRQLYFDAKDRASWAAVTKARVEFAVTALDGTSSNNVVYLSVYGLGIDLGQGTVGVAASDQAIAAGYAPYDPVTGREGSMSWTEFPIPGMLGSLRTGDTDPLASCGFIELTNIAPTAFPNYRIYVRDPSGFWRLWDTIAAPAGPGTSTYTIKASMREIALKAVRSAPTFTTNRCVGACAYKGWVVWLYQGGKANVRHSRIGEAEWQADANDLSSDTGRGATFTMADNFADEPVGAVQAGPTLFLLGKEGVYAQVGDSPSAMNPPRKMPGSLGCAGPHGFCRFRSDDGLPGVAWLDTTAESVWFIGARQSFLEDVAGTPVELTQAIRGYPRRFLLQGGGSPSDIRLACDDTTGALWLIRGDRALVLRPPAPIDGKRYWEAHRYELAGSRWVFCAFSPLRKLWAIGSNGRVDELEWNSSAGRAIDGPGRDGGLPMPRGFWKSGTMLGPNRRFAALRVEHDEENVPIGVRIESTRQATSRTIQSWERWTRFGPMQSGQEHTLTVFLEDVPDRITSIEIEEQGPVETRRAP